MARKKCCYMNRECTSTCIAYTVSDEIVEGATLLGLANFHCIRLFLELADFMMDSDTEDFEDFEYDEEF